ncbi:hypothetical protein ACU4GR_07270 [Methylobacterium oryzae CBMB20]
MPDRCRIGAGLVERIGTLMRAEALAGGRDVRNKGVGPALAGLAGTSPRVPAETLWDD